MILGIVPMPIMLLMGGLVVLAVLLFQLLQGLRKIKFKGRTHLKVHRNVAFVLVGLAAVHALMGIVYVVGIGIG